jgi:Xaa-Pro aminopeptidase
MIAAQDFPPSASGEPAAQLAPAAQPVSKDWSPFRPLALEAGLPTMILSSPGDWLMLTPAGCRARRQRLWQRLDPALEWILIADPQHLLYFANYWQSPFVFRSNDAGAVLILGRNGSSTLVADNLLQPFCDRAVVDEVVAPVWYRGVASAPPRESYLVKNTLERLARCPGRHYGYEPGQLPAGVMEGLKAARDGLQLTDVGPAILAMRRQKDTDELDLLRLSMRAAEAGMAAGHAGLHAGMTELELCLLVQRAAIEAVGEPILVYGDFVSGPRCEQIGGPPTHRRIEKGDLVILDFSPVVSHYRVDIANTFVCGERPSGQLVELYEACLAAMAAGEKRLRPGVAGRDVDRAVRGHLASLGLDQNFPSHSGHGVGLGHPEAPFLVPESSDTLQAGDVVTLEPGQYIPGVAGMRFEHNYLITDNGYERLSHHPLSL